MKRAPFIQKIFAFALTAIVLYTVSVREVHYLFSQHEAREHCENHLHGEGHHEDCSVCKFDVSFFTDGVSVRHTSPLAFAGEKVVCVYQPFITNSHLSFPSLRGPPVLV